MSDLISREAVIHSMIDYIKGEKTLGQCIDDVPIAYDVDKVVDELEDRRSKYDCKYCRRFNETGTDCSYDCSDELIQSLIDIVKKGGAE